MSQFVGVKLSQKVTVFWSKRIVVMVEISLVLGVGVDWLFDSRVAVSVPHSLSHI